MENVTYFLRNHKVGFSIQKVFDPILRYNKIKSSQIVSMPSQRASPKAVLTNMIFAYRHRNRNGVNHITGDCHYLVLALPRCKTVLTIHDIGHYKHVRNPIKRALLFWLWHRLPVKYADAVTCISEATKEDLLRHIPIDPRKITVIGDCYDPSFTYTPKTFNKECPDILHVGTSPNKNLHRVIEALEGIYCHLTIVGPLDSETSLSLKKKKIDYTHLENLTDEEILNCYKQCDIVSFPSLFEGFGMPVIEGKAVGRPVLTSDLEPMKTIAGSSCCLVDPLSSESIRKGFKRLIEDDAYRDRCIRLSLENVKQYSVEKISDYYNKVYSSVIKK